MGTVQARGRHDLRGVVRVILRVLLHKACHDGGSIFGLVVFFYDPDPYPKLVGMPVLICNMNVFGVCKTMGLILNGLQC